MWLKNNSMKKPLTILNARPKVTKSQRIESIINFFFHHSDLGAPFFPGGPELWHHPLAYSAAAGELPGSAALQHATLVHPALHPQMPVRSYLWLNSDKSYEQVSELNVNGEMVSGKPQVVTDENENLGCRFSHHKKFNFDLWTPSSRRVPKSHP